jgi:hypothetical protein
MATKEEILAHVVRPLTSNYGSIKDDPEAFRDLLLRTLSNYTPMALDRAVEKLVMTRRYKTWPTIAEIVEAARNVAGDKDKPKYPHPMKGITADNFWQQSSLFVERDFEARGTCLEYVRKGTAEWQAWAIYFDILGLNNQLLNGLGWYAPTQWPWQFDTEKGPDAQPPIDFIEYDPEIPDTHNPDFKPTEEEKQRIVEMWGKLKVELLKSSRQGAII